MAKPGRSCAVGERMRLYVSSLWIAEEVLAAEKIDWIIGILDPGASAWKDAGFSPTDRLRLEFHDIHQVETADPAYTLPTEDHVRQLIDFVVRHRTQPGLIHCHAGVSRSTACALTAVAVIDPNGIRGAAFQLRNNGPWACPNPLLIGLADDLLNINGELIRAAESMGSAQMRGVPRPIRLEV